VGLSPELWLAAAGGAVPGVPKDPHEVLASASGGYLWLPSILLGILILLIAVSTIMEKVRGPFSKWAAGPELDAHEASDHSHSDIRQVIALLAQSKDDLQRQIDRNEQMRRESMEHVQRQLTTAISLLRGEE
jgi:hypothetical protein